MSLLQKSSNKKFTHTRKVIGIHPVIQFFIEKINIHRILNSYFIHDERSSLSFEKAIGVLIHNILTASSPMYEIQDWCKRIDESCLGLEDGESNFICDDKIGRSLDKFYNGRHKDFFFQLALKSIKVFKLNCSSVHQDTTTITFSGKYDSWQAMELATHGHNKDHRPDLKQLVLGMTITKDGAIPLHHQVYSGNQTDDTLHIQNFQKVQSLLQKSDFIYVADSKLATLSNLSSIHSHGGKFITVMPKTWTEEKEFKDKVKNGKISWTHLYKKKDKEDGNYESAKGEYFAKEFNVLWIRSESKKIVDSQTRSQQLLKACDDLNSFSLKLNKRSFKEAENIKKKIEEIIKSRQCQNLIEYSVSSTRDYKRSFGKKGRPSKEEKSQISWSNIYAFNFKINDEEVERESLCDGIFPLITNVKDKDAKEILELYKYQPFLEKRHSQLKTWQRITPVLLKKDTRVIAYVHMHVLALTISTLIERTIRQNMKKKKIESLALYPEKRACKSPTFFDLERLFRDVEKYEVQKEDEIIAFPAELNNLQKQVLNLLEMPPSAYH
jgi:transposase